MPATFLSLHPVLGARDVPLAVAWYVERLGFTLMFNDATDPIRYAGVRRDSVELHLQWQDERYFPAPGEDAPAYRFLVDDPDALFTEFRNSCALHATAALRNPPWHTREFAVHDPNGHGLTFCRPL
jgi:catechol 2,3-dioxygenase-like lactoylglutathione lyase family enzyme